MKIYDTLLNLVSMMGTSRDKRASTGHVLTTSTDGEMETFFRESWLAKKIVTLPAYDMFREWRNWQGDDKQIEAIEKEEKRLKLLQTYMTAMTWARLYGYCAIYISNGDLDVSQELKLENIGRNGIRFLNILLPRQLQEGELEYDPESANFMKPKWYEIRTNAAAPTSLEMGVKIHPSRLIIFEGDAVPDPEVAVRSTGRKMGGDSILKSRKSAILDAEGTAANIASLIYEAKVDVIKVPNLFANLIDEQYRRQLMERFELAATMKGINGTLVLDTEEEYDQKNAQFGNLGDLMNTFVQQVSGASDIPITRLLGQSPGGMNATGEHDLRNYYDHIGAMQKVYVTPVIQFLDELVVRSALGDNPDDIFFSWAPLWQLSQKEIVEIGKTISEMIAKLADTGLYPQQALAEAGANLLVENSALPGFLQYLDDAGGIEEFLQEELDRAERDRVTTQANLAANGNNSQGNAFGDAAPGPKSLYVRRDVLNASEIIEYYSNQGVSDLLDPAKMHVTIIYSETPVDWFKTGEPWDSEMKIRAGGARDHAKFGPPGQEDALVLMISSNELRWRHEAFKAAGAVSSYDEFNPHITLRYNDSSDLPEGVEPFQGEIKLGPEIYQEVKKNWSV